MEQAGFVQVVLGSAMNIAMFVLVVTGVMKLFQAASDLRDMRQMLQNQLKAPHVPSETPDLSMPPISLESLQSLANAVGLKPEPDRKSTRLNSSHVALSRMPSSA